MGSLSSSGTRPAASEPSASDAANTHNCQAIVDKRTSRSRRSCCRCASRRRSFADRVSSAAASVGVIRSPIDVARLVGDTLAERCPPRETSRRDVSMRTASLRDGSGETSARGPSRVLRASAKATRRTAIDGTLVRRAIRDRSGARSCHSSTVGDTPSGRDAFPASVELVAAETRVATRSRDDSARR